MRATVKNFVNYPASVKAVTEDAFGFVLARHDRATLQWLRADWSRIEADVRIMARMADVMLVSVTFAWAPNTAHFWRGTAPVLAQRMADAVRSHNHGRPLRFAGARAGETFAMSNITAQSNY